MSRNSEKKGREIVLLFLHGHVYFIQIKERVKFVLRKNRDMLEFFVVIVYFYQVSMKTDIQKRINYSIYILLTISKQKHEKSNTNFDDLTFV